MSRARLTMAVALLSAVGCRESPPPVPVQPAAAVPAAPAHAGAPRSPAELPTTDGALAASTFLGLYQAATTAPPDRAGRRPAQLVPVLMTHAQYFGALDDYDAALRVAEAVARAHPRSPEALLQRAAARQSLHLFAPALDDLQRAERLGADRDTVDGARAGILQALGRDDEALAIRQRLAHKRATTASIAALAQLEGDMGRLADAEAGFDQAEALYGDPSPFPLAWLYFQYGLLEERAGRPSSARELYEAAHARLPRYAPATAHLAGLVAAGGDRVGAIALLEPLARASDDPEYWAQLGTLLMQQPGGEARGAALIDRAKRRYQVLVRRHGAAFADHAARFWLGAGHDPARALALARRNLEARPTRAAYDLVIEAALAAGDARAACAAADRALRLPYVSAALHVRASTAYARCGRGDRAEHELFAASR